MEYRNLTPFDVMCFSALDKQDVEYPVIVMKVGYRLEAIAERPGYLRAQVIDDDPVALCLADKYFGEDGRSSVKEESDLAPYKPRCDVLINGHAHAPNGAPTRAWVAGIRLSEPAAPLKIKVEQPKPWKAGEPLTQQQLYAWRDAQAEANLIRANTPTRNILLDKRLRFTGPRVFRQGFLGGWHLTEAELAENVPLLWEYAFGGSSVFFNPCYPEQAQEPFLLNQVCYSNPLGRGWIERRHLDVANSLELPFKELPAPQIELTESPIDRLLTTSQPDGDISAIHMAEISHALDYRPAGFGIVGRAWAPRLALAGTYDSEWQDNRWPGLPADFDFSYWNAAPADQQTNFIPPDARIELFNLTPPDWSHNGQSCVELPGHRPFLLARLHSGAMVPLPLLTDTLLIDTDAMTLSLTHRISLPSADPIRTLEARFEVDPNAPLIKRASAADTSREGL